MYKYKFNLFCLTEIWWEDPDSDNCNVKIKGNIPKQFRKH